MHLTQQVHTMSKQETRSKPARRQYAAQFKNELVQRCLQPGASVSGIALENGINANVLFRWRREHLQANGHVPHHAAGPVLLYSQRAPFPLDCSPGRAGRHALTPRSRATRPYHSF